LYILQTFVYLINDNTHTNKKIMTTSNNNTATKNNENAKANIIAFGIMAIVIIIGVIYGMQLDAIGY
jgi:hypothetical protein